VKRDYLLELLANIKNAKKEYRDNCAQKILADDDLFSLLVSETFNSNNKLSIRSAWILEWICTHYGLEFILLHLDEFTNKLESLRLDGAMRSCAKICESLSKAYHNQNNDFIKQNINKNHLNKMVETCFEWIITPQTIAVKAYSINALYFLGFYVNWVHPELEKTIRLNINTESKAYKARGKKILYSLNKLNQQNK